MYMYIHPLYLVYTTTSVYTLQVLCVVYMQQYPYTPYVHSIHSTQYYRVVVYRVYTYYYQCTCTQGTIGCVHTCSTTYTYYQVYTLGYTYVYMYIHTTMGSWGTHGCTWLCTPMDHSIQHPHETPNESNPKHACFITRDLVPPIHVYIGVHPDGCTRWGIPTVYMVHVYSVHTTIHVYTHTTQCTCTTCSMYMSEYTYTLPSVYTQQYIHPIPYSTSVHSSRCTHTSSSTHTPLLHVVLHTLYTWCTMYMYYQVYTLHSVHMGCTCSVYNHPKQGYLGVPIWGWF